MPYTNVAWADDDDITEEKLDQMDANGALCYDALAVLPLHVGHLANHRWPIDIYLDETVIASAVAGPVFPWYPKQINNIRIDGLNEGFHTLRFYNSVTPRDYKVRFFKTADMSFLTLWLIYYANNLHAATITVLGHATEQIGWV